MLLDYIDKINEFGDNIVRLYDFDRSQADKFRLISLLAPFCKKETKGYQWLYDVDSKTDFLFSPGGTW
jgi:hypothetical protein